MCVEAVEDAEVLRQRTPQYYSADYACGIANCILSLLEPETIRHTRLKEARSAYETAIGICSTEGVRVEARDMLAELGRSDPGHTLRDVEALLS
jgi:hypothetical protein